LNFSDDETNHFSCYRRENVSRKQSSSKLLSLDNHLELSVTKCFSETGRRRKHPAKKGPLSAIPPLPSPPAKKGLGPVPERRNKLVVSMGK